MLKKKSIKLKYCVLIALSFTICVFFSIQSKANDVDSMIPNKDFQNLILENMKSQNIKVNSVDDITQSKMNQLTYVRNTFRDKNGKIVHYNLLSNSNPGEGSYSIEGLQYAKNLKELQLSSNLNYNKGPFVGDITDIGVLKNLYKLEYVSLYGNRITSIDSIINIQNHGSLKYLDIINNSISDLSRLNLSKYSNDDIPSKRRDVFPYNTVHNTNPAFYDQNTVTEPVKVDKNNRYYKFILQNHVKLPSFVSYSPIQAQRYFYLKQNHLGTKQIWPYTNGAKNIQPVDGNSSGIIFNNLEDQNNKLISNINAFGYKNIKVPYNNYLIVRGGISADSFIVMPYIFVDHGLVNVHYKDVYGNQISDDNQLKGKIGNDYQTHAKSIPGYYLDSVEGNEKGQFTAEDINVTYRYRILNDGEGNNNDGGDDKPHYNFNKFAIYSIKHIYMYKNKTFNKKERIANYHNKPRIKRPMFVVYGTAISKNHNVRYLVRDVNHHSETYNKKGYITNKYNYVRPVYYQGKHQKFTVINPAGINSYKKSNLTKKVKNYKQGTVLKVKSITKHNLTTRYILTNGHYITGNRKLIIMGNRKQVKKIKTKHAINVYKDKELKHKVGKIKKNRYVKVDGFDYSKENKMKVKGTKRYKIKNKYVTANNKFVRTFR